MGMYSVGQKVVYGIHGVCSIVDVERRKIDRKFIDYYVLEPIHQCEARFYIPSANENALKKIRPIITKEKMEAIVSCPADPNAIWTDDENQRKQRYREMITNAQCEELLTIVRALYRHKNQQLEQGKKFHLCDENFLRDAERLIRGEVSCVLGMEESEVGAFLERVFSK